MSKAHVDPVELRRFASDLVRFNNDLAGLVQGLHGRLRGLEATWKDQEQKKFSESFEQAMKVIGKFINESEVHAKSLGKKASVIEEYLKQR
jgi:uncharacterized protein YukE